ncbi:MAG: hypothetical protein QW203_06735, partial [Thermoplasmatales archaeon]
MKGRTAMVSIAIITLMVISGIAVMPLQPAHAQTQIYPNIFTAVNNGTIAVTGVANHTLWKWKATPYIYSPYLLEDYPNIFIFGGESSTSTGMSVMGMSNFTIWKTVTISSNSTLNPYTGYDVGPPFIAGSNIYLIATYPNNGQDSLFVIGLNNYTVWKIFWEATWDVGSAYYYEGNVYFTCYAYEMASFNATTYSITVFEYGAASNEGYTLNQGQDLFIINGNFIVQSYQNSQGDDYFYYYGVANHTYWHVTPYEVRDAAYNPSTGNIYGYYYSTNWYLVVMSASAPFTSTETSIYLSSTPSGPPVFTSTDIYLTQSYSSSSILNSLYIVGLSNLTEWKTLTNSGTTPYVLSFVSSETAYQVQFTQTSLGYGDWYVNVTGQTPSGAISFTVTNFDMNLPAGTYSYTVATNYKIEKPVPSSGSFTVSSSNIQINVTFEFVYYT